MSAALIDTGFIYAVLDRNDALHKTCAKAFETEDDIFLPEVVLTEMAYLILRENRYGILVNFLRRLAAGSVPLISAQDSDLERAAEILEQYQDSKIDFVDAMVMAIAERLDIKRILTVDRRDFSIFRPVHCGYFEIIP